MNPLGLAEEFAIFESMNCPSNFALRWALPKVWVPSITEKPVHGEPFDPSETGPRLIR